MTVTSATPVSEVPPTILCISGDTNTLSLIVESRAFGLCFLGEESRKVLDRLGFSSGSRVRDKLAKAGVEWVPGRTVQVPLIRNAHASLECTVLELKKVGGYTMVLGRVRRALVSEDFHEYWRYRSYHPLLYYGPTPSGKEGRYVPFIQGLENETRSYGKTPAVRGRGRSRAR
jgi:flavin reductase (DIM6/NTAB) family NADH-FMN oxidoreductase RutF